MLHNDIERVATLDFIYKASLNKKNILVFIARFFSVSLYSLNHEKKKKNTAIVVACVLTIVGKPNQSSGKRKGASHDFRKKIRFKL